MQYAQLGRTGLMVSRLCLGTMNFGPYTSEPESHRMLDQALDLGITFIDTADVYGWQIKQKGLTPRRSWERGTRVTPERATGRCWRLRCTAP